MNKKVPVFLSLGGNIGDTDAILKLALQKIEAIPDVSIKKISNFYRTSPVGNKDLDDFTNIVCLIETSLTPKQIFSELQAIERMLGKIPKPKNASRPIDIDILFYGNQCYCDGELEIPHPRWKERLFVLIPLQELTPTIAVKSGSETYTHEIGTLIKSLKNSEQKISLL